MAAEPHTIPVAPPVAAREHEELVARRGARSGLHTVVAVHSTALGPALGGRRMVTLAERTEHVTGLPAVQGGSGDPSAFTAQGVEAAMRASCAAAFGDADLAGRTVAVVGCGHVGERLARRLVAAGALLLLAD